jgi:hypothetical protein
VQDFPSEARWRRRQEGPGREQLCVAVLSQKNHTGKEKLAWEIWYPDNLRQEIPQD